MKTKLKVINKSHFQNYKISELVTFNQGSNITVNADFCIVLKPINKLNKWL